MVCTLVVAEAEVFPDLLFLEGAGRRRRRGMISHSNILLPQAAPRGSSNRVKRNNIAVFYNPSSQSKDCVSSKYLPGVADERLISYVFSLTAGTSLSAINLHTGLTPL